MSEPQDPAAVDWIALDWGTTRLRARAVGHDGGIVAEATGPGMGALAPGGFEPAFLAACGAWLAPGRATPALACGMVGAREGWAQARYASLAAPLDALADGAVSPACDPRIALRILPGLAQDDPPDVMRGEETQVAGLLAMEPRFEGVVVAPGTHAKWIAVAGGRALRFRTFMTGELFALLAERSVLRHALAPEGEDAAGFSEAVAEALDRPEAVLPALFGLRAAHLLRGADPVAARSRLSGLLIGLELAGAADFGAGPVTLVGAPALCDAYARALGVAGRETRIVDGAEASLAGLARARARLFGESLCAP